MKIKKILLPFVLATIIAVVIVSWSNNQVPIIKSNNILFLHHSTGNIIYHGGNGSGSGEKPGVAKWFDNHNRGNGTSYRITRQYFPKAKPYGWNNYPYDYYNIWVKHAGGQPYLEEPTLEMLTKEYGLIIFKHCFPVSNIIKSQSNADIDSPDKILKNYKLQYQALKEKMLQFPDTKFLLWTGAALLETHITEDGASRAKAFFEWVKNEWDTGNDNIYLWDFYDLETEGNLYLKVEYARSPDDSHPGKDFTERVAPLFCQRIVDVIENNGKNTTLTGKKKQIVH